MEKEIKEQIIFVLEDDNEVMTSALSPDSGLDTENKLMNTELIKKHEAIINKVKKNRPLAQEDLQLVRDANEIHLNDIINLNGRYKQAVELDNWLDLMMELPTQQAFDILEKHLHKDSDTPAIVFRALHTLWEEITPNDVAKEPAFDDKGKCLKCGSKISFADVTDTLVFVGDEIVKRHDGDITNRNCVRCTYPNQYCDYAEYDKGP
jgi:hypothetical protein